MTRRIEGSSAPLRPPELRSPDDRMDPGADHASSPQPLSGRPDLNRGPHRPERCALPGCATPREAAIIPDLGWDYLTASIAASISAKVGPSCRVWVPCGPLTIAAWPVRMPSP